MLDNTADEKLNERDLMKKYFKKSEIFKKFQEEELKEDGLQSECDQTQDKLKSLK
jgi:hypothetical protein